MKEQMTGEQLRDLLVDHAYILDAKQCKCQTGLNGQEPQSAKDWKDLPVYGVFAWAEHVADVLNENLGIWEDDG